MHNPRANQAIPTDSLFSVNVWCRDYDLQDNGFYYHELNLGIEIKQSPT